MSRLKDLFGPMRVPFLLLSPACVVLGFATAVWSSGRVSAVHFLLALVGATLAHIGVNALNEYWDFRSGLDATTRRTPFSGGSGTLPARPELARQALGTALVAIVLVCGIGAYFLRFRGPLLLLFGVGGLLAVGAYTPWLTRRPLLCLVTPGLGFGTFMVMGTHFALTGEISWTAFIASCVPFFLVNNLLLLNQFPDVEPDRAVGRRHLPILIGRRASSLVYGAFLMATFLTVILGVALGHLPGASLLSLIMLAVAIPAFVGAYRHADDVNGLVRFMGLNVVIVLATPVLAAVGLFIG